MSAKSINGYVLQGDLSTKNSGFAKWGFATKNGREFFIKEFLSPVYPVDESLFTERMLQAKKKGCETFQNDKANLYKSINQASDGNIVCVEEFFRSGGKYYITMEKINTVEYKPTPGFSLKNKQLMCLLLTHSLAELHSNGVVHADLKWDNILFSFSPNNQNFVTKLIDFDNSFINGNPPASYKEFQIDQVYCAPEAFLYSNGDERFTVNDRIDVFALGLIFHKILTNELPVFDSSCKYAYEAAFDGKTIELSPEIDERTRALITKMISPYAKDRPSSVEVYNELADIVEWDVVKYPVESTAADEKEVESQETDKKNEDKETVVEEKKENAAVEEEKSGKPDETPVDNTKEETIKTETEKEAETEKKPESEKETEPEKKVETTGKAKVKVSGGLKFSSNLSYSSVQRVIPKESIPGIDRKDKGEDYFSTPGDL